MFDIGSTELLLIVIVAVVVIGPKDLPRALYKVGQIVGKARGMARHFRTGIDAMVREVELEELEKKWAEQNRRIMEEHPADGTTATGALILPAASEPVAQADEHPPFVAEAPATPAAAPATAADGPPYIAQSKGDAAA